MKLKFFAISLATLFVTLPAYSQSETELETAMVRYLALFEQKQDATRAFDADDARPRTITQSDLAAASANVEQNCQNRLPRLCLLAQAATLIQGMDGSVETRAALVVMARAAAKSGKPGEARLILVQALNLAMDDGDILTKAQSLAEIAPILNQTDDSATATRILNVALRLSEEIGNRDRLLQRIATSLAEIGDFALAELVIGRIGDTEQKTLAMAGIAPALAISGEREMAVQILVEARNASGGIERDDIRIAALTKITIAFFQVRENTEAQTTLALIQGAAEGIEDNYQKASALIDLATTLNFSGRHADPAESAVLNAQALGLLNLAKISAYRIENKYSKPIMLARLSTAFATIGDRTEARLIAGEIEMASFKTSALSGLALAFANSGELSEAYRLSLGIDSNKLGVNILTRIAAEL